VTDSRDCQSANPRRLPLTESFQEGLSTAEALYFFRRFSMGVSVGEQVHERSVSWCNGFWNFLWRVEARRRKRQGFVRREENRLSCEEGQLCLGISRSGRRAPRTAINVRVNVKASGLGCLEKRWYSAFPNTQKPNDTH